VLPHVDAGYNLARWLLHSDQDAEDAVQTAAIRAFQGIDGFRGTDGKAWFLSIVRRSSLNLMRQKNPTTAWEEGLEDRIPDHQSPDPEQLLLSAFDAQLLNRALDSLPPALKEIVVLRELEDMSYKEIAIIIDHPIGTVMSRLSKARRRLQILVADLKSEEAV